jgi:hypothetical protein
VNDDFETMRGSAVVWNRDDDGTYSLLGCAFLGNSPGIPFGEFTGTWFLFLQEPIFNAVQTVQERPKTHSFHGERVFA